MVTMIVGMKNILTCLSVVRNLEKLFHIVIPKGYWERNCKFALKKKSWNLFTKGKLVAETSRCCREMAVLGWRWDAT